ncbi:hypothetical protein [Aestuariibius sp. HNIBRBA575]|uniref:hypothetical protein n=1 Tax=Aestuariibius sp. HNIBRBA575 TaxID=3233343 RepID=UPI0034A26CAB
MTKTFFTYVWGAPGNPAWPLTFATKSARSHARKELTEGDLVFTVGTKGEPTQEAHKGRVLGVFRVSDLEVNTQDYGLPRKHDNSEFDSVTRFPFALHPIAVWEITSPGNIFAELVGSLTPNHHLQAQSKIVELDDITAAPLLELETREMQPALPETEFGKGLVAQKNSKLAPKHEGSFTGMFGTHDIWYVYTLVLRDAQKRALAVKVGYSSAPEDRETALNRPMATEVTGLQWKAEFKQPTASEDAAREVEQIVLGRYANHKLESNGEILAEVDPMMVQAAIATARRDQSTS